MMKIAFAVMLQEKTGTVWGQGVLVSRGISIRGQIHLRWQIGVGSGSCQALMPKQGFSQSNSKSGSEGEIKVYSLSVDFILFHFFDSEQKLN